MYYVYILRCGNGRLYVGCTRDLKDRFARHRAGHVPATVHIQPVALVFYCGLPNKYIAFQFEKYLKSASGRAFTKKHLIR
ncbi:MAG: GIY-YIG nuclease family protein [bacterium]|nr:GIY-YIG nuclease family protein [bacterium]